MPNKGLGRGFDALLPQNFDTTLVADDNERIQKLLVSEIVPNADQPRQHFDEQELEELASSIKRFGILQPLVVTPHNGGYMIIAGERRFRAANKLGLKSVPAIVRSSKELEQLEIALIENVQRVDLSPLEQAGSIQRLHDQFTLEYEEIAKRLGKATTTVLNIVRLLGLPASAQEALKNKVITEGHARAILALKDPKLQEELLSLIKKHAWSVRQAEQYVTAHKQGAKTEKAVQRRLAVTTPETERLGKSLKTKVSLRRTAKSGRIEIAFKNETELKRILKHLQSK